MTTIEKHSASQRAQLAAKEKRIRAIQDKGYGVYWECELARQEHCRTCKGPWCATCGDW